MTSNFKNLDYCESTRNIDNMLSQYISDRATVINLLNNNIETLINNSDYDAICWFHYDGIGPDYRLEFDDDWQIEVSKSQYSTFSSSISYEHDNWNYYLDVEPIKLIFIG